jgi:hypothetical protein
MVNVQAVEAVKVAVWTVPLVRDIVLAEVTVPITTTLSVYSVIVGLVSVLLVSVCVAVVPTIAPLGTVSVVYALAPLPTKRPLSEDEPDPPLVGGSTPVTLAVSEQ